MQAPNPAPRELRRDHMREVERKNQEKQANRREARAELAAHAEFIHNVEMAAAHHPEIDKQVFFDIITAYETSKEAFDKREAVIKEKAVNKGDYAAQMEDARRDVLTSIHKQIDHHPDATAAMNAIAHENQPKSMFTPLVRMFHNTDEGGLKFGALAGAGVIGGLAYYMTSSAGSGGLLTWGVTAAATLIGAYMGGQIMPNKSTIEIPNLKGPNPRGPVKTPEVTVASPGLDINRNTIPPMPGVTQAAEKPQGTQGFTPDTAPVPAPGTPLTR